MLARSIARCTAAPLRKSARGYATESGSAGGIGAAGYAAVAAVVGGGGYYYYANYLGKAPAIPNVPVPSSGASKKGESGSLSTSAKAFTGGDQGFVSLVLSEVEVVSSNVKKFTFKLPEENQVSGLPIASAVVTKYQGPEQEKPVIRPYTPTSDEDAKGIIEFVIKKYPNGAMSEHLFSMNPGQRLDIKGPIPKYPITANKHDHIAMIAGGTGITPMYQVLRGIFKNPDDKTKVTLIFGNIAEEDILLKKELQELENTYPQRFRAFYTLDKPPQEWTQGKGHITKELLKTVLPEPKAGNIKVFVCGPPGLYKAISGPKKSPQDQGELTGILKELGYSSEQVFKF